MVVFEDKVYITALATQGGVDSLGNQYYVTSLYLTMSIDRLEWIEYFENEQLKVRDANILYRVLIKVNTDFRRYSNNTDAMQYSESEKKMTK